MTDTFDYAKIVSAPVILYGAGRRAQAGLDFLCEKGAGNIVCLCDANPAKHRPARPDGAGISTLPVLSPAEAKERHPDAYVYVTLAPPVTGDILVELEAAGFYPIDKVINAADFMRTISCASLDNTAIFTDRAVNFCCTTGDVRNPAHGVRYKDSLLATMESFSKSREAVLTELNSGKTNACTGCPALQRSHWRADGKITHLIFFLLMPCPLSCCYCRVRTELADLVQRVNRGEARRIDTLGILKEVLRSPYVAPDARVELASGELTIDPQRNAIFDVLGDNPVTVVSNGVYYDERVAGLIARPGSFMNLSLDAGTQETYRGIKKLDAFDAVVTNIGRYLSAGGMIRIKYIVIEENSSPADIDAFVDLCANFGLDEILVSSNTYSDHNNLPRNIVDGVIRLYQKAREKGIFANIMPVFGDQNMRIFTKAAATKFSVS